MSLFLRHDLSCHADTVTAAANHASVAKENATSAVSQSSQEAADDTNTSTALSAEQSANLQLRNAAADGHVKQSHKEAAPPQGKPNGIAAEVLSPSSYLVKECR